MLNRVRSVLPMLLLGSLLGPGVAAAQYGGGGMGGGGMSMPVAPKPPASPVTVTNLVEDQAGATQVDPHLVNAWGLVAGPATPWWVDNATTNTSTLYNGTGTVIPLVVSVPGQPTGIVFNGGSQFALPSGPAVFLFATEAGILSGWNLSSGTTAETVANRSSVGAVYTGLAIATTPAGDQLFAADFHNARIDVFDGSFNLVSNPSAFVDKKISKRFAPFNIQNLGGTLFVTYAKQDKAKRFDVPGAGLGFVDMFDTGGNLLGRVATKGGLDAPWGLAMAPSAFGDVSGDLLVGNFGNGKINAYERKSNGHWKPHGPLRIASGKPVRINGLWALSFGNDGPAGPSTTLYFTAGPSNGSHGVFGSIATSG
jgi:uncharacterized protein (TIGR03118 family)